MVLFASNHPVVKVPDNLTTWEWLFESRVFSSLHAEPPKTPGAFIDAETKERLDYSEVRSQSAALSNCWVLKHGLNPGDAVTVFSGNSIWYPVCMFAAHRAGARMNGASVQHTADEMVYILKTAKTKIVVTAQASLARARTAAAQVGLSLQNVFVMSGDAGDLKSVQDLIRQGELLPSQSPYRLAHGATNKELCGNLNFSSGTTGLPKPVMISHHSLIAQCHQSRQIQSDAHSMTKLAVLPLYHIIGTWRFCLFPIFLNVNAVMLPSFSMQAMLRAIVEFHVEELALVPPIVLKLARDPIVEEYDLRHVKRWTSGAAAISTEVLKSLEERFPWTGFRSAYGATEAPIISSVPESHYAYRYQASVGMLMPNTMAKIIDPSGKELGPGEEGEILAKGPQIAMGYLDNEKATRETFDGDGFYHTGDMGYFDQDGFLFIKDRIKEMIKVKGIQVAPAELEDLLLGHDLVADCAVIGTPDEYAGEFPKAYIVLKSGIAPSDVAGHSILEYVRVSKARYKWLAEVEFIDKIPKSASGKLLRQQLRESDRSKCAEVNGVAPSFLVRDTERFRR